MNITKGILISLYVSMCPLYVKRRVRTLTEETTRVPVVQSIACNHLTFVKLIKYMNIHTKPRCAN